MSRSTTPSGPPPDEDEDGGGDGGEEVEGDVPAGSEGEALRPASSDRSDVAAVLAPPPPPSSPSAPPQAATRRADARAIAVMVVRRVTARS
ncbi:hypothetical protein LUW77_13910 [Streptomyces radiopugnans]|nr:hypothetical protein LUW77_13910 [Streptomyces radiopugnans]